MRECSIEDCTNKHLAGGLCRTHYLRKYKYGDPTFTKRRSLKDFKTNERGCHIWQGAFSQNGSGMLYPSKFVKGFKTKRLTRIVLAMKLGRDLLPGMQSLHTCDDSRCINADHLYEGTQAQNVKDCFDRGRRTQN